MNNTTRIIKTGLLILLITGFGGCSDNFLSTNPTQDVSDETVTATPANMMLGINGIHRSLYIRYLDCQGCVGLGALMIMNDVLGEDYVMTLPSSQWHYGVYRWQAHRNAQGRDNKFPWLFYYQIIRNANVIINGEDVVEGAQPAIDIPIGQALYYRAFSHFQLVQLYAERYQGGQTNSQLGIPVVLKPENTGLPRSPVEEVYQQIHTDLDEALNRLSEYDRPEKYHIDRDVVKGLKARVYLVQQDWENAARYASEAREGYPLMTQAEYRAGFNDLSNGEWIWGSRVTDDQGDRWGNFGSYNSRDNSTTNIRSNPKAINTKLYHAFPDSDIRLGNFDPTGEHEDLNLPSNFTRAPYTSEKFLKVTDRSADVPYMRAAEMYLIEAEALANMGNDSEASRILYDLVSARDTEYTLSGNTGLDLLEEIYLNRRLELWGEGFRFNDLKRLNQPLDRTGANHIASAAANLFEVPAGDNRWQYLIPRDEIDANPQMEQNPI